MNVEKKMSKKLISIITPVFNEEDNVNEFVAVVSKVMTTLDNQYDYEVIFTDNHSTDQTFEILKEIAGKDNRIRVFRFSKNYGYQKSILTGYTKARGDCAIQLDCDLQDSPELISDFICQWEKGYKVVYGVRKKRKEGFFITALRRLFYRMIDFMSEEPLPHDAGDFRLVDRLVLDELKKVDDCDPYLRGMIAVMGFKQIGIPYERSERKRGLSKFSFLQLVRLAVDGISNHSIMPLRFSFFIGIGISLLTTVTLIGYVLASVFFGQDWPSGFATIIIFILFSLSIQAIFLGLIGEYIGRIYRQLKIPASVIIEESINEDP